MGLAAGVLDGDDLVVHLPDPAGEEGAAVDHHVDLVRAGLDRGAHVGELHLERRLPGGERRRHGGDLHVAPGERAARHAHEAGIDADRRDRRDRGLQGIGPDRLRAERTHLARGVRSLEGRQVHHPDREVEREELRLALDRPLRELGRPRLEGNGVDGADAREATTARQLERPGGEQLAHDRSLECARRAPPCRRQGRPDPGSAALRALLEARSAAHRRARRGARASRPASS